MWNCVVTRNMNGSYTFSGRIRRLKRTVPFTFRRLEGGLQGGFKPFSRGLEGGFTFVKPSRAWRGLQGGLRRASRGLQRGLKGAWEGRQGGFKGAWEGLQGGFKGGLEKGLKGASRWRGLQGAWRGLQGAWEGLEWGFKMKRASRRLGGGFKGVWARFERCLRKAWNGLRSFWEAYVITCASNRSLAPPILTCAP